MDLDEVFPDSQHATIVLDLLNKQRKTEGALCDVSLYPTKDQSGRELRVHKCLVSLNPNLFKLLKERPVQNGHYGNHQSGHEYYTELDTTYDTLQNILDFMYTGKCNFKQDNVIDTIQAAAQFGMERLRGLGQEFLNKLTSNPVSQPDNTGHRQEPPAGHMLDHSRYPWLSAGYFQLASKSPLVQYLEFWPACMMCASPSGNQSSYFLSECDPQHCARDILLAKYYSPGASWKRIRNIPYQTLRSENTGLQYQLCKEIQEGSMCSYGDNCTFSQSKEELDVWNAEKRGIFMRHWIVGHLNGSDAVHYLRGLLSRYGGSFVFKNVSEDPEKPKRHLMHQNAMRIRDPRNCKMEICWHENKERGSCKLGDSCHFAHSELELEVWILLNSTNLSAQQLVQFSGSGSVAITKRKQNRQGDNDEPQSIGEVVRKVYFQDSQGLPLMIADDNDGNQVLIRNVFGVFKNQNLPKRFMCCSTMRETGNCPYQNKCLFAHSLPELMIWRYQMETQIKDQEELLKAVNDEIMEGPAHKKPYEGNQNFQS